jgi:amidase
VNDVCVQSGEPVVELLNQFMTGTTPLTCNESWDINLKRYAYQQEAQEHWNNTVKRTSTGRPIDAYISPVAASAAVKPNGWVSISTFPKVELI